MAVKETRVLCIRKYTVYFTFKMVPNYAIEIPSATLLESDEQTDSINVYHTCNLD